MFSSIHHSPSTGIRFSKSNDLLFGSLYFTQRPLRKSTASSGRKISANHRYPETVPNGVFTRFFVLLRRVSYPLCLSSSTSCSANAFAFPFAASSEPFTFGHVRSRYMRQCFDDHVLVNLDADEFLPVCKAADAVDSEPANGSSTTSFGRVLNSMMSAIKSIGFCVS